MGALAGWEPADSAAVALSAKIAGIRSSLAEPYFVTRQRVKQGDPAALVKLKKQTSELGKEFQTLMTAHERQEVATLGLRQRARQQRQELEAAQRQLDLARRTVDRLAAEKAAAEAAAAAERCTARKLEARLLALRDCAELEARCAALKAQADQLAHALHEAEARAAKAETEAVRVAGDRALLRRGVELAAEQLTKSAGVEVPGTLLLAVARGQEEACSLSEKLADAQQQLAHARGALDQARAHLSAQQHVFSDQSGQQEGLLQRVAAAEAALYQERSLSAELHKMLDALRPQVGGLAEERDRLRQQLHMQETAAAEAQQRAKKLEGALKQREATELALRSELRRAMALGASPLASQARSGQQGAGQASPAPAGRPAGSRLGAQSRQSHIPSPWGGRAATPTPPAVRQSEPARRHRSGQAAPAGEGGHAVQKGGSMPPYQLHSVHNGSLLSPPSSGEHGGQLGAGAVAPPAGSPQLMRHDGNAALDEQTAQLQTDLEQLERAAAAGRSTPVLTCTPTAPLSQPKGAAGAGALGSKGHSRGLGGPEEWASGGAPGSIPAWRPGWQGPGAESRGSTPEPSMWHDNPLAASPRKQPAVGPAGCSDAPEAGGQGSAGSSAATSLSLRLASVQEQSDSAQSQAQHAAAPAGLQPLQLPAEGAGGQGLLASPCGHLATLHADANSDWLSPVYEPDIEQLQVASTSGGPAARRRRVSSGGSEWGPFEGAAQQQQQQHSTLFDLATATDLTDLL